MTEKNFDWLINQTLDGLKETLVVKGKEYRRFSNPFHNFEEGAKITGKLREEVLWGFAMKHYISIQDMKEDLKNGKLPSRGQVEEKYNDLLIYLLLEKISLIDRIEDSVDILDVKYAEAFAHPL